MCGGNDAGLGFDPDRLQRGVTLGARARLEVSPGATVRLVRLKATPIFFANDSAKSSSREASLRRP